MIPKIGTGKGGTKRLIAYLYGPGKHNEHTDQHMIAWWNDFAPDPKDGSHHTYDQLADQLDQPVRMLGTLAPTTTIWHCSLRAAPDDRPLSDDEWADIARRILHTTGIAPRGDLGACRWVAIRHALDHIHIAATLVRQDGRRPRRDFDRKQAQAECRRIETDHGLRQLKPGDGTAAQGPTSKEHFKAKRQHRTLASREILRTHVRQALTVARNETEFLVGLRHLGVTVETRTAPSGALLGYKVALPGDTNANGEPVYFAGSTLAPDLSLPRIRQRLTMTEPHHRTDPWHQAITAADRIPTLLDHGTNDAAAQAHLAAFGEALDALPALAFERATRSRIQAEHHHAHALRSAVKTLLHTPSPSNDGAALAMLLDVAVLIAIAAVRWHHLRRHEQQEAAARTTLHLLESAYIQAADAPLTALARQAPPPNTARRYAHQLRETIPTHAEQILNDRAWLALSAALGSSRLSRDSRPSPWRPPPPSRSATPLDRRPQPRSHPHLAHPPPLPTPRPEAPHRPAWKPVRDCPSPPSMTTPSVTPCFAWHLSFER